MSSCASLIFSHIFLSKNIHGQMIFSSLDTNAALTDRSSIAEEQRNPCLWNGHLHISFYPYILLFSHHSPTRFFFLLLQLRLNKMHSFLKSWVKQASTLVYLNPKLCVSPLFCVKHCNRGVRKGKLFNKRNV